MVISRLRHLLETFLPVLFFTLADVVDPISVFSVAGLVTAFVVVALVIHHLAFLYLALMVFVYGLPGSSFVLDGFEFVEVVVTSSALYLWDVVVYVVSSPLFQVQCIAVALYVLPYVDWYLDTMLTIDAWRHDVGVWISRVVEVGEDVWFQLEDAVRRIWELVDKTESLLRQREPVQTYFEHQPDQPSIEEMLEHHLKRQREYILEGHEIELRRLGAAHAASTKKMEDQHNRLLNRLDIASRERETIAAAHRADCERFIEERAALDAKNAALRGAVVSAVDKLYDHKERCREDRQLDKKRYEEQAAALEVARKASAQEVAAAERRGELRAAELKAENDLLVKRLASVESARDAIVTSYQAHIEQSEKKVATHEAQYAVLEETLQAANTEHRIHITRCERERIQVYTRNEDLAAKLGFKDAAFEGLKSTHDALTLKHREMSEAYTQMEARLKAAELELCMERQRYQSAAGTDSRQQKSLGVTTGTYGLVAELTLVNPFTKKSSDLLSPSKSTSSSSSPTRKDLVEDSSKRSSVTSDLDGTTTTLGADLRRVLQIVKPNRHRDDTTEKETAATCTPSLSISTSSPRSSSASDSHSIGRRHDRFVSGVRSSSTPRTVPKKQQLPPPAPATIASTLQQCCSTTEDIPTLVAESTRPKACTERIDHYPPHPKLVDDGSEHTVFAAGLQATSTASAARAIGVSRPRQEMQLPVERNTPPATEPFAPVLEARSSTGSGSSAGRRGFEAFAEGVKKSSTPRTARCECAPRQSPYEEAKHVAFVAGLGPTSTPRVASETSAGCNGFEGFAEGVKKSSTPWIARCDRAPHQQRRSIAEDVSTLVTELPQAKAGIERIGHCPPHSKLADDGSEHTVFAAGLQASSTASAARAIAVSRPRQETQKPAEHNTPPATESSVPVPEVRSSTGSKSSAGRRGFGALAEGVKKRLTPRTARCECEPRHSPHEEAKHTAFVAGLGPTSTPWAAYPQRFPQPSVERRRPADVKNELRDTSREHRAQPSTHSPTLSTTSLKAGSLPRPDVVESASSEGRYAKFIARLNAMSTPRDVQERLKRRVQSAKGQRNDSSNSPPPQARTGKPLDSPSPQPEIASKLQLPRLMDNEDRFKAFASGVQATSTPPSVTAPPAPHRPSEPSSLPPPPPPPASAPASSAPSPPTPPVKTNRQHNGSDNGSAPQAHTGKPLSLSSPHSEIASKPPTSPCLTKSEDWYKAFALGVQATSTPPSVTPPPALQQPSGPSCPLSLPPPVSAPAPPSSPSPPPVVKTNEKAKQKPQMPTSESFFRPRSIKSPLSKPVQKFVLKSCIPPLPEFIEGSSKDGLPLGKTPAVVRYRRESRYIPGSPETPCRESKAKSSSSKVFDRLEGMLGALNRQRDGVDQ